MKIHQLLSGVRIPVTNEEQKFMERFENDVRLTSLDEHDKWLAQSLVRKGVYAISKDSTTLINNVNETTN
jgi:hypothetical protein